MLTKKFSSLQTIVDTGIVLIVRLDDHDDAIAVAEAAIEGGIRALEITYSVPGALDIIRTLSTEHGADGVVVGAGTVLDAQSAFAAIEAGARLLVSPNLEPRMIEVANRYQAVSISGAFTPSEIVNTMTAGADFVKLFPTDGSSLDYVKTILAPLPQTPLLPTGGLTAENVGSWIHAGIQAVGVGSAITKAARSDGDYQRVTEAARTFLAAITKARQ